MFRRQTVTTVLALLVMGMMGGSAEAQSSAEPVVDFVVSPSRLEIRAEPGDRLEVVVEVFNRGSDELLLDMYVEDIAIPPTDLMSADDLAFTASRWIRFSEPGFEVASDSGSEVTLEVNVPTDTPTGGYHAFAYLQSHPTGSDAAVVPSGRIGVTLLLEVAPAGVEPVRTARVATSSTEIDWSSWLRPQLATSTTVENHGETHVTIGGVHTYRSWPGSSNETRKLGPYVALRGTLHTFESETPAPLLGRVAVTTEIVYQVSPDNLPVIVTQEEIWIIPWHLVAAVVVSAGLLLLWRKKRNHEPEEAS